MMKWPSVRGLLAGLGFCAGLLGAPAHAEVLLRVEGGLLTGASGVLVNGALYDVSFQDGSCNSLQLNCTQFTFNNADDAGAAAQALLDQVFSGLFDTTPSLTRGCTLAGACIVSTIYGPEPLTPVDFNLATTTNTVAEPGDRAGSGGIIGAGFDTTPKNDITIAVWTAAPTSVPEPSALGLALAGLGGLVMVRRHRRR
ncbi:MAG: PEP-CTERM sorting domain-containing protein [Burkholderiales bacterium]|nr:PEP-CTERM sorting domain-containing protein [Burkholderiales bacterium]